jgi:hypothetical protein
MSGATGRSKRSGAVRTAALALTALGLLGMAGPALAGDVKLTITRASERAEMFAESTCKQDANCVGSGVLNCHRKGRLVVHCRIFDDRRTDAQGSYRCNREIRMVMDPDTRRAPVNGLGRWHCGAGRAAPG